VTHALRELDLETLPVEEFMRRCALPVSPETIEGTAELVAWFVRRYPTAQARFAYIRRARARVLR
jgi:hypothetical protein